MWWYALLCVVALLLIKLISLCLFWSGLGIPYESLPRALYKTLWQYNREVMFDVIDESVKRNGKIYGSYRGLRPSLIVADLDFAKEVMKTQFNNFFERTFETKTGDPLWDYILSMLPAKEWKAVRGVMGTCFTASKLKGIIPKFDKIATRSVNRIENLIKSTKNEIALHKFFRAYSLDSVVASSFGVDLNSEDNPNSEFMKHASNVFKPGLAMVMFIVAPGLIKYLPFVELPPKETSQFFTKFGTHVLEEKRKNLDRTIREGTADILDNFLIAQREDPKSAISDEVIASQAFLFYMGGVDTTVTTLDITTYYLTQFPEVQEKVYKEIIKIMGDRTEVTYEDVIKMRYLEATLSEAMRFYSLVPLLDRICTKDTTVRGMPIKAGTLIEFPVKIFHFDPNLFPEPEIFQPERFLRDDGTEQSSDTTAFLTFGDGPKNCIGKRLAFMNLQVILCKLLMKVKLEKCSATPPLPLQLKPGAVVLDVTKDPLIMRLTPRK